MKLLILFNQIHVVCMDETMFMDEIDDLNHRDENEHT